MFDFDIETGPREEGVKIKPFDPGRLKDPKLVAKAKEDYFSKLALYPTTGEVLTIGYGDERLAPYIETRWDYSESELIKRFWSFFSSSIHAGNTDLFGCNIFKFDLPFLMGRSRILGVQIPGVVQVGRNWHRHLRCISQIWTCYNYGDYIGLEEISRAMGFGGKPEEDGGKNFYLLFRDEPERAIQYAKWDIVTTMKIASKLVETGVW